MIDAVFKCPRLWDAKGILVTLRPTFRPNRIDGLLLQPVPKKDKVAKAHRCPCVILHPTPSRKPSALRE